jgi:hypothetical protein
MSSAVVDYLKRAFGLTNNQVKGILLGLDGSGRTTALYKWKLDQVVQTIPTIGFNVETIRCRNLDFVLFDVGGCDKIRYQG